MKVYGIIMEVNPFHNGHKYFLEQVRAIANDGIIVCVVSTNIVQRGEISTLNKQIKTDLLLANGVDIICELPTVLANQGGKYFALSSLKILKEYAITDLVFGSETNDLATLIAASENISNQSFSAGIHSGLNDLASNDILGISYLQAIANLEMDVNVHLVQRKQNSYNQIDLTTEITSATAIRANYHVSDVRKFMPALAFDNFLTSDDKLLYSLFKLNLKNAIDLNINIFLSENQQLLLKLQKHIDGANSISELVEICKDKNNSASKLRRIIINTVLMIVDADYNRENYNRVLGFNRRASKYIPANSFTNLTDNSSEIAKIERRSANLFQMLTTNYQFNEYNRKPTIKENIHGF